MAQIPDKEPPNPDYVPPKKSLTEWKEEADEARRKKAQKPEDSKAHQAAADEFKRNQDEGNIR
jgi:hypothetical protein